MNRVVPRPSFWRIETLRGELFPWVVALVTGLDYFDNAIFSFFASHIAGGINASPDELRLRDDGRTRHPPAAMVDRPRRTPPLRQRLHAVLRARRTRRHCGRHLAAAGLRARPPGLLHRSDDGRLPHPDPDHLRAAAAAAPDARLPDHAAARHLARAHRRRRAGGAFHLARAVRLHRAARPAVLDTRLRRAARQRPRAARGTNQQPHLALRDVRLRAGGPADRDASGALSAVPVLALADPAQLRWFGRAGLVRAPAVEPSLAVDAHVGVPPAQLPGRPATLRVLLLHHHLVQLPELALPRGRPGLSRSKTPGA